MIRAGATLVINRPIIAGHTKIVSLSLFICDYETLSVNRLSWRLFSRRTIADEVHKLRQT